MSGKIYAAIAAVLAGLAVGGCGRVERARVEWPTMGTIAAVQTRVAEGGAEIAAERGKTAAESVSNIFAKVEKLLNAHDPESELSRLAPLEDAEILRRCDPLVRECYAAAFRFRDESGGAFNPRWRGAGTLDLGGIAKGFAVDLAAAAAGGDADAGGAADVLIDLGGNLKAVKGDWNVGILGAGDFRLKAGSACATSAEYFRGRHIYDSRTGKAVTNELESVTIVSPSAMEADALSTICFIFGREQGEAFLKKFHPDARAIWSEKVR